MRASTEAIIDFGRQMQAGPIIGALMVGTVLSGCTAPESDGMLQDEVGSTACWIESMSYDPEQDALNLEIAVRSARNAAHSLGYTATNIMSEQPPEGERVVSHDVIAGKTTIINTTGKTETHQAVVAFNLEESPHSQYGVQMSIAPEGTSSRYCGDMDFVFTRENGELVAEPSDMTTVCAQTLGRPILVWTDQVDGTRYTSDPSKLLANCP